MKHLTLALASTLLLSAPAFAKDYDSNEVEKEKAELRESQSDLDKDNADIRRYEKTMQQNRAEKARAKAEGNYGRQARESLAIGANKAAIQSNKAERYVNEKRVEEDREDLRDARGEARNDRYHNNHSMREGSPSAGRHSTFMGMASVNEYPIGIQSERQLSNVEYWQGSERNRY